jgi:AraC-like DNA-binding protein
MVKNNITEKGKKEAVYRSLINPEVMDGLKERILKIILFQKRYRDKDFSAKKLAEELGTNMRYISAVVNVKFHMNYTSFVNKFRIEEAMTLLADERYRKMSVEDVSDMIGFSNRQSFYASFLKITGITPREYKMRHKPPKKSTPAKRGRKPGSKNKKKTVNKK